jgi:ATP-dependent RNA helicase RhlE
LQKRKEDPDFKGAFHEKKTLNQRKKFDATKEGKLVSAKNKSFSARGRKAKPDLNDQGKKKLRY